MTTWGAWSSNNRLRAGLDLSYSPSSITSDTTSVTVSWTLRGQTRYASYESGTGITDWWITGDDTASGSMNGWNEPDMGTWVIASGTEVVNLSFTSTQDFGITGKFESGGAYPGTQASVYDSITIPKRPYAVPSAPSSCSVARVSDTSHTVTWARVASSTAPVHDTYIERWDNVGNKYVAIATITTDYTTSASQSYTDTKTVADRQYRYRVRTKNSSGYSGYTYSGYIKTTPAPPGTPSAAKNASDNIVVTWPSNSAIAEQVEVWHAADGVWDGAALATIAVGTTYTHTAPNPAQTHKYRLRSKIATPALTSAYSAESNTVQLAAPPNAPTNLTPESGTVLDATEVITTTWQHNPVDTTPQRQYQRQWRINGDAWVQGTITTSSTPSDTFSADFFTNGSTIEWQVRTWGTATTGGSDGTGASPWSATSTLVLSSVPTATINSPDGVTSLATATATVTWGYYDAEGTVQSQWTATLSEIIGGNPVDLETLDGSGTQTAVTFATPVLDGHTYRATVQVRDSAGAWSLPDSVDFLVDYAPPPVPQGALTWDEANGVVLIEATVPAAGAGEVQATSMRVWRSADGGDTWQLAVAYATPGSTVTDHVPPLNTSLLYRVEAISATPSSQMGDPVGIFTDNTTYNRQWLNYGSKFGKSVFLSSNVAVGVASEREKTVQRFAGREFGVEFAGIQRERIINVKGTLFTARVSADAYARSSTWDEIEEAVIESTAPACIRDLYGHRWFVSVNKPSWDSGAKRVHGVSFTAEQIDYHETTEEEV